MTKKLFGYYSAQAHDHLCDPYRSGDVTPPASKYKTLDGRIAIVTLATKEPLQLPNDDRYRWPDTVFVGELGAWIGKA